ncbi:MAG TPA: sigma-70 family RNA polymerase sigma factor [Phycisphaerae bacterium]|nr:sigma-70 family RNA polymerase sigma factor [Phycisphaerales bacterium]HRX86793.1 sigma-70 family RNA polymerase sigma factor [Phycisphaerae bacterium]
MSPASPESRGTDELLARVRAGSDSAIEQLLAGHRAFLRAFVALRMDPALRQRVDPSDVVQDAQIEIARRMADYAADPRMPLRLWLRQITYDRLLMLQRRHAGAQRRTVAREIVPPEDSSVALAEQVICQRSSPSEALIRGELVERVRAALHNLSEDDREMVLMRNFEGLSNAEVAALLQVSPAAASKRYGRALLRLRTGLRDDGIVESNDAANPNPS